jgi:phosphoribosylanthranilate isomerase
MHLACDHAEIPIMDGARTLSGTYNVVTRVKICGITRLEDALLSVELGAAALGFNFYPRSPRYITPEKARAIIRTVPPPVMTVGVFADETSVEHVLSVARQSGVNTIQLHGVGAGHVPAFVDRTPVHQGRPPGSPLLSYPLIRALTVDETFRPESLQSLGADAFLLDAFHPTLKGGTGLTIDWTKAREATSYGRVILAGGLTPENVAEAIRQVRPFAVDVASGVESAPGAKDASKLRAFFAEVHEADRKSPSSGEEGARGW